MRKILLFVFLSALVLSLQAQLLQVQQLRCEYRQNPLGIEVHTPMLGWQLVSPQRNVTQTAYEILVDADSAALAKQVARSWNSGKVNTAASIQVPYAGRPLQAAKKYYWKLRVWDNKGNRSGWSKIQYWQMGLLTTDDWKQASWIAYEVLPDSSKIIPAIHGNGKKSLGPGKNILPLFRKVFAVNKRIRSATMFISGLGHFEMSINGKKTGDHFLDPGWTQYDKQALYVCFDIKDQLQQGSNCIGVELGNGFYYIPRERYRKLTGAFGYPKMICRLQIEYADGSSQDIVSDASWKTTPSPTIFSSIYGGEDYDANLYQAGWNKALFNDRHWKPALLTTGPACNAQQAAPLKVMQVFEPVSKKKINDSVWVYDMSQNMSGIPRITVQGKKGDTVKILTAELLNPDGTVNQKATGSPSYYRYILKGNGAETWQPKFTYYGFRYIQVERAVPHEQQAGPAWPVLVSLQALHTRNAAAAAGSFSCSNELFNQTHALIDWAIRSNMASVFTDCPHREKLGWLEEAHLVGSSISFRYDIAALCRKVVQDMIHSQTPEGLIPDIAPEYVQFEQGFRDSPEWGSNCILLPWYMYQWYGDRQVLEESYAMMQQYASYLQQQSKEHILMQGLGDWYDLGPQRPGFSQLTPQGLTATAIYYYDLTLLQKIAELLGKPQDAQAYDRLAAAVRKAFNKKFFNESTFQYGSGSQAANAMAVYMKLVDEKYKDAVVNNIIGELTAGNHALTAGDIGFRYLLKTLDQEGRSDLIYRMNNRSDVPGYGYQLAKGATALTESWQALPVVSNNHLMLGHIMEWFYAGLAGIGAAEEAVGYDRILIRPQVVGDITYARAEHESPYGTIRSEWKKGKTFQLSISIPANTTARVELPASAGRLITENGQPLAAGGPFNFLRRKDGTLQLQVGSGNYNFEVK